MKAEKGLPAQGRGKASVPTRTKGVSPLNSGPVALIANETPQPPRARRGPYSAVAAAPSTSGRGNSHTDRWSELCDINKALSSTFPGTRRAVPQPLRVVSTKAGPFGMRGFFSEEMDRAGEWLDPEMPPNTVSVSESTEGIPVNRHAA